MTRRDAIALAAFACAGCRRGNADALEKGVQYLWAQQAADGGWHSRTYGLLAQGLSLTPFVLEALSRVPETVHRQAGLERALSFIRSAVQSDVADYPAYSTALAVSAICRARRNGWRDQIEPMLSWLRTRQFTEQNGWRATDAAYGAWGMGGERRTPPGTGHVDLSMTRYALQALRDAGLDRDPAFEAARVYVQRCQNPDGGFFFTTTEFDTNKAGHDGKLFRSYGTTTADGILALLAIGIPPSDACIQSARRWFTAPHPEMLVPGFTGGAYQRWPRGLAFYYASSVTEAFRALGNDTGRIIPDALKRLQEPDGSWSNSENLVKEDDPLIATAFAIRALL